MPSTPAHCSCRLIADLDGSMGRRPFNLAVLAGDSYLDEEGDYRRAP